MSLKDRAESSKMFRVDLARIAPVGVIVTKIANVSRWQGPCNLKYVIMQQRLSKTRVTFMILYFNYLD